MLPGYKIKTILFHGLYTPQFLFMKEIANGMFSFYKKILDMTFQYTKNKIILIILLFGCTNVFSQNKDTSSNEESNWSMHIQNTTVFQTHSSFSVPYSGDNSLNNNSENATSNTTTLFLGRKLWKNAALFFNGEATAGNGLSKTLGIAGFPNGEIYRVGDPKLTPFMARLYLQQTIPLKNSSYQYQKSDQNQIAQKIPDERIVITVGKFCISDFFDNNSYNHDARSQFLNWSLMAQGAWDFPADTRGYTRGFVVELIKPSWALRLAAVQVPRIANEMDMDWNLNKANSETFEYEQHYKIKNLPGIIRTSGFATFSKAPLYNDAIAAMKAGDSSLNEIIEGHTEASKYGSVKYGFGVNIEQTLSKNVGLFARYSWNDGHSASWAFTEIDRSLQAGISINGNLWKRKNDIFSLAGVINGLSPEHKNYLAAGGYGFLIGDGKLNYGHETIFETYYSCRILPFMFLSADYQMVINPAYNKDRKGPVHIPALRLHFEW